MSHEKAKEQTKVKKQATKSLKEKRAAKKAKKADKSKQEDGTRVVGMRQPFFFEEGGRNEGESGRRGEAESPSWVLGLERLTSG